MISAEDINTFLDALYCTVETRFPNAAPLGISTVEIPKAQGEYGAVVLGMLLVGQVDGKITLVFEWEPAVKMNQSIDDKKSDIFDERTQELLQDVLAETKIKALELYKERDRDVEIQPLPVLTDTNVLYGTLNHSVVQINITSEWGPFQIYFSIESTGLKNHDGIPESMDGIDT